MVLSKYEKVKLYSTIKRGTIFVQKILLLKQGEGFLFFFPSSKSNFDLNKENIAFLLTFSTEKPEAQNVNQLHRPILSSVGVSSMSDTLMGQQ